MDNAAIMESIQETMARIMKMQEPTKFEKFQEDHPYLMSLVWLFIQCIGLGVIFLLFSAKKSDVKIFFRLQKFY